jgi:hypothetical protein
VDEPAEEVAAAHAVARWRLPDRTRRAVHEYDLAANRADRGKSSVCSESIVCTYALTRQAQHDRPLPWVDFFHRAEGEGTPPPREQAAAADDDLVGVVSVALVADVI